MENIRVAIRSVRNNMLRSVLTLLIIAFGIMALVGILTAIDSIIYSMGANFSRMGANVFTVVPKREDGPRHGNSKRADAISFDQALDFKERFNYGGDVAISVRGTSIATVKYGTKETNPNVSVQGWDENNMDVNSFELEGGRNFTALEAMNGSRSAIVGMDIVNKLFDKKPDKALNEVINVNSVKYKIIGILKSKGSGMGGSQDNNVFIPLLNAKRYYGSARKNYRLQVGLKSAEDLDAASSYAIGIFRNIRKMKIGQDNDFEIHSSSGLVDILKENTVQIRSATAAIGLITLLSAAIGLMNIMLVSVTERTREIGICKALGATRQNIMIQFLTEAIVICQLGGIVGVILGVLIGFGISVALGGSFIMPWAWIIMGITVCLLVGLISGLYPALKAARLDPIESLRYE